MVKEFPTKALVLMQLYFGRLSEKDRRQFAALEALKYGHGGISSISRILGIDRKTIGQGIKELKSDIEGGCLSPNRQRKQGGGRKKNRKKS